MNTLLGKGASKGVAIGKIFYLEAIKVVVETVREELLSEGVMFSENVELGIILRHQLQRLTVTS